MQYRQCKCGKARRWDTGEIVHPCQGCEKCQTTFGQHPNDHEPLQPHDLKPQFNRNTGEPDGFICSRCYARVKPAKEVGCE